MARPLRNGLLAQALEKSGRAGEAKYAMRQRQHPAALLPSTAA